MALPIDPNDQNLLPPADWAAEIEKLNEGLSAERDRHLLTVADFKNYRRRIEHDGNSLQKRPPVKYSFRFWTSSTIMEKTLQRTSEDERPLADGVKMICQKLLTLLEKEGVHPIESIGKKFDPEIHHAVAAAKRKGVEHGTIIDDLRRGYFWKNELLRPAQVRIAE